MPLESAQKAQIIKNYQRGADDTGSPEVQIALLSARIEALTGHLKDNKQDRHSRHGLLKMVSQRRSLLKYFKRTNPAGYTALINRLDIRG